LRRIVAIAGALMLAGLAAFGQSEQEADGSDNGFLSNLLENRLSAPGRQIRLSRIEGALSSQARIGQITVSDEEGVWLEIDNVELDWSRLALLRRRVEVESLTAERVAVLRRPVPVESRPAPRAEAQPFALPELPVAIRLNALGVNSLSFDEGLFGQAAELSLEGNLFLVAGALDTELEIVRQDEPGGNLALDASYSNESREIAIDLQLHEPSGGIVADLIRIEGEPAIDLTVAGAGPIDNVDINFDLQADGDQVAQGLAQLRGTEDGQRFDVDLTGGLSPLIPEQFRDFFEGETAVRVSGISKEGGGLAIEELDISGAELDLDGRLETGPDGFLRSLQLTGALGDPAGPPVVLPVPGGDTRLQSARLYVDYGQASRWDGFVVLDRLEAGGLEFEDLTLDMGGLAQNLEDPERRNVSIQVEGLATGVYSPDPDVARALGSRLDLFADVGLPPDAPIDIRQFQVTGDSLTIFTAGTLEDMVYEGRAALRLPELAILSGLAGRELGGEVALRAAGSVTPLSGGFDLTLDGGATDLSIGDPRLDPLLAGETEIAGRAVRDENGIRTDGLRVENPQISFASDGVISSARTDIGFDAHLADLSLIDPELAGELTATGRASGSGGPVDVTLSAALPQGRVMERDITGLEIGFDGQVDGSDVTGSLSGDGQLDELVFDLAGDLSVTEERQALSGLRLALGPTVISGDIARPATGPLEGQLEVRSPDIAPLAALAQIEATGSIDAQVALGAAEVGQGIGLDLTARDMAALGNAIDELDADLQVSDAFGLPMVEGELSGRGIRAGGLDIAALNAQASAADAERMEFSADARLAMGTLADLTGELVRLPEGFAATLETLRLRQDPARAILAAPATVTIRDGAFELTPLELDFGTGRLTAAGSVGEALDLTVDIDDLPLNLANTIRPDLGLAGTISGEAEIGGTPDAPQVSFDLTGSGLASAATAGAGLPPIAVEATGRSEGQAMDVQASVTGEGNLAARASGSVPLTPEGAFDLGVDLQSFPLALVDRAAGNQGLTGTLTGTARITGPLASPRAQFEIAGDALSARILRENGMPAFGLQATGGYGDGAVVLDRASLTGPFGLGLDASGRVPLSGPGLDLRVNGAVPLQMATPVLAQRAAAATGTLRIDAAASGSLAAPSLSGSASLAGGTFIDPDTNLRLENIALDVGLQGDTVSIRSFGTNVAAGGRIEGQGSISVNPAAGFPADISVRFLDVHYTDGAFATTRFDGQLSLTGPAVGGGGLLAGDILLGRTELLIPEGFGGNAGVPLEQIQHRFPPPRVVATLRRAEVGAPEPVEVGGGGDQGLGLDIDIAAPNQIFIRGRGLDAEVGGELTIGGTTSDLQPVGAFEMRRGRIVILGQRIEFTEGSVTLDGNLDPVLNFVAETQSGDVVARVSVTGRASDPVIEFSSTPELPQDEVLARLLFNRAAEDLSAFQLAQLAAAAAELAGVGGGSGVLSELRSATGLDNLDVVTEESGATAVRAGKYIDDNIYLDVQTDSEGVSRAGAVLDITEQLTARGSVGSDGDSILGLFFERDY
jgi:translocation and assembly module TamB